MRPMHLCSPYDEEVDESELLAALGALVGPERAKRTSEATLV
jgi:hypothetical protein